MTIKFEAGVESALVIGIADGLAGTVFKAGFIGVGEFAWAEKLIGLVSAETRLKFDRFLGEQGLARFVRAEIAIRYYMQDGRKELVPGAKLTDIPEFSNTLEVARGLVEKLKSLPLRYRLTVALPQQFSTPLVGVIPDLNRLPSNIVLATGNALPGELPMRAAIPYFDDTMFTDFISTTDEYRTIEADRIYFSMPILGYAVSSSSSALGREFEDYLRAFYGAAIATRLIAYGWSHMSQKLPYITIHEEEERKLVETERLEDDLLEREYYCATEHFAERNAGKIAERFKATLDRIGTVFIDNADCRKLFTACIWFYRAKSNRRHLDALLEATIAIEVMLGDRRAAEGVGLTNLLGSRCAYLLGKTSSERASIEERFKQIYGLRSAIVHDGRHGLKTGERSIVEDALKLCASIIQKELAIRTPPPSAATLLT